jgi:hypothetical protein
MTKTCSTNNSADVKKVSFLEIYTGAEKFKSANQAEL